jgi:hypothetical protein
MTMTEELVIPKEVRALFALRKLSDRLQTYVLALPGVAQRWDIKVQRTMTLVADCAVTWDTLFSVFRSAADGSPTPPLIDSKGNDLKAAVSLDSEGAALVAFGRHRLRFTHAILMASDPARRALALQEIFKTTFLSQQSRDELLRLVNHQGYSVDQFLQASELLSSSPDEFASRLAEKARGGRLSLADVLPEDEKYWNNLTAPCTMSVTLPDFINGELAFERAARINLGSTAAFRSIALTFSAAALVPHDLFATIGADNKISALEAIARVPDHFSLVGAFELCAACLGQDPRFIDAGNLLLDALLSNMDRLETACGMFAAAFVLTIVKLAEDEATKAQPAYWRRLAAASHAQLVVRSCGVTEIKHDDLLQWALNLSGEAYFASLLSDFATDPQWHPEWIDNRFLVANVCGRAIGTVAKLPAETVPQSWKTRIDQARSYVDEKGLELLMMFPAVLEGARRTIELQLTQRSDLADAFQPFLDNPTVDNLLLLTPLIYIFGYPRTALDKLQDVTASIRSLPLQEGAQEQGLLNALNLLAHIAAVMQDVPLADTVAATCVERLAVTTKRQPALDLVYRVIECSAAETDRPRAASSLVQRLEQISLVMPSAPLLIDLGGLLETLKMIGSNLETRLGRAIATAKLAASSIRAA